MLISEQLKAVLPELKEKYSQLYYLDTSEFRTDELSSCVVIRPLTRAEFNSLSDNILSVKSESVDSLLVYKENVDNELIKAGFDKFILDAISAVSGFSSEEQLIASVNNWREYAKSLEAAITVYICKAFPSLTPLDVEDMFFEDQMKYLTMAEQLIGQEFPFDNFFGSKNMKKTNLPPPPEGYQSAGPGAEHIPQEIVTKENLHEAMRKRR